MTACGSRNCGSRNGSRSTPQPHSMTGGLASSFGLGQQAGACAASPGLRRGSGGAHDFVPDTPMPNFNLDVQNEPCPEQSPPVNCVRDSPHPSHVTNKHYRISSGPDNDTVASQLFPDPWEGRGEGEGGGALSYASLERAPGGVTAGVQMTADAGGLGVQIACSGQCHLHRFSKRNAIFVQSRVRSFQMSVEL